AAQLALVASKPVDLTAQPQRTQKRNGGDRQYVRMPPLKVRVALHSGQAELRDGDYFGATLSRVARLLEAGHGGQILLSAATHEALGGTLPAGAALKPLGVHHLRDLQDPEGIFQMLHPELPGDFAPLRTVNAVWMAHHSQASRTMAPPWFRLAAARPTP